MKALSFTQPWGTLVAVGEKRIETRSWLTRHRGPLAIHAARGLSPIGGKRGLRALCKEPPFARALHDPSDPRRPVDAGLPRGAIVAVAELVDVLPIGERLPLPPDVAGRFLFSNERHFGDYTPGRYAWLLRDVVRLPEPVRCAGTLGLWTVPDDVAAAVDAQVDRARSERVYDLFGLSPDERAMAEEMGARTARAEADAAAERAAFLDHARELAGVIAADVAAESGMPCPSPGCPEGLKADGNVLRCPMHGPMLLLEFGL